jgi:Uma2 family endonuclease
MSMSTITRRRAPATVHGVPYDVYVRLRDHPRNEHLRMVYFNGTLQIMAPAEFRHERGSRLLGLIVLAYAVVFELDCEGAGSTTFRRGLPDQLKGHGKEPDQSFYIAHAAAVREKDTIDLEIDPPPDLWIEVDNQCSSQGKLPLYAALGIPEIWRYRPRRRTLWFGRLQDGAYVEIDRSIALPRLTPAIVLELLAEVPRRGEARWDRWMREWMDTTLRQRVD